MKNVLIYQRPVNENLSIELNAAKQSDRAKAYLDILMVGMNQTAPQTVVETAVEYNLYKPAMFMTLQGKLSGNVCKDRLQAAALEAIFSEGNGYGNGDYETTKVGRCSSLSVGDIVADLESEDVHLCMPNGWLLLSHCWLGLGFDTSDNHSADTRNEQQCDPA